jgi:hypothetical protein
MTGTKVITDTDLPAFVARAPTRPEVQGVLGRSLRPDILAASNDRFAASLGRIRAWRHAPSGFLIQGDNHRRCA